MRLAVTMLTCALWIPCIAAAQTAPTPAPPLLSRDLRGFPAEEGQLVKVVLAPGEENPVHRHNAHVFLYVLEGSVVMQVRGGPAVTLRAGETFYENPDDIHVVGRNVSKTQPATFLAFFVKKKDAPRVVPVP